MKKSILYSRSSILDKVLTKNYASIAYRVIDGQAVIVNLEESTLHTLNLVATRIWELADAKNMVMDIIDKIYQEFEVDRDRLEKDCLEFVNRMISKGLFVLSSHPVGGN